MVLNCMSWPLIREKYALSLIYFPAIVKMITTKQTLYSEKFLSLSAGLNLIFLVKFFFIFDKNKLPVFIQHVFVDILPRKLFKAYWAFSLLTFSLSFEFVYILNLYCLFLAHKLIVVFF